MEISGRDSPLCVSAQIYFFLRVYQYSKILISTWNLNNLGQLGF